MRKRPLFIITLILVVGIVIFWIGVNSNWFNIGKKKIAKTHFVMPSRLYGIPIDSFKVKEYVVKRDQNLSNILSDLDFTNIEIDKLNNNAKGIFDLRTIKSGHKYALFKSKKTKASRFLVYENSPMDYVVFQLYDSFKVEIGKEPVEKKHRTISGVVESSLWNTMNEQKISPMLAMSLYEIYQYSIDFFGIQKGDKFRVVYDELQVGGQTVQIEKIYAAEFVHMGQSFTAIPFKQNGQLRFFDQLGKSMRKAFRKAPLDYFRITSLFSNSRFHPVLKIFRPHHGVDYAAPIGTPVYSIGDGTIMKRAYQPGGGGNYLMIKHNATYSTSYMHLRNFAGGTSPGARVKMGQVIGYVGRTGLASGPHLDFRVYLKGTPINPLKMVSPPSDPIRGKDVKPFKAYRDSVMKELSAIQFVSVNNKSKALRFFP
ncbi:MAG: peptidoglycan DD-metalloendopeptidase family protein [Bacteroidota bacterium]|nr:peptidoglycan DD-metalloendopeptidase family protein [Bacteroidota bacterium]MDP4205162.1 peptidoglycan DD-metalloendopeptidase family protein [Bacteroidota bacterium]